MSALSDFAEYFKARKVRIRRYYEDGVGKWAFRVVVDGQSFVCCARTSTVGGGTGVMKRVAERANDTGAYVALRTPDGIHVFDPVAILNESGDDSVTESDRRQRGEEWVVVPLKLAVGFDEWYDGRAEPVRYDGVESF